MSLGKLEWLGSFGAHWSRKVVLLPALFVGGIATAAFVEEYKSGIPWPEPVIVTPGAEPGAPPSDAIVLFDGKDLSKWQGGDKWKVEDGYCLPQGQGGITTTDSFGDVQLHIEFATPSEVKGSGQGRGNSGIYFLGKYELQVLDSYENKTYFDGQAASIYKQKPPLVNACRKPGEWQSYDVLFTGARFDESGKVTRPAAITVLQNGVCVQNHFQLIGGTFYDRAPVYEPHPPTGPIHIQDHGDLVRFRNIWVRPLVEPVLPEKK